jgi:hypothetical protein
MLARLIKCGRYEHGFLFFEESSPLNTDLQKLLDKFVAPLYLVNWYHRQVSNVGNSPLDEEKSRILKEKAQKVFSDLSADEIVSLLKINWRILYRYRLRKDAFDERNLENILREDYPGKTLDQVIFSMYRERAISHKQLLWDLLF